jgi:SAM-dependent methyltransferase
VDHRGSQLTDLAAYREQSRTSWREVAAGWERRRDWFREVSGPVTEWLLDHADPQPGETFLELAAGTGDLSLALAERVGPHGRVVASDFAPEMIDAARRAGLERGAANVDYRVLDAERLDLDDASVDGVVCRFAFMLMADPGAALAGARRALRPTGRLALAVWQGPDRNPWAALPAATLVRLGHAPPPEPGTPGIFALADPNRIRALVTAAGFSDAAVEEIAFTFRYADADELWDTLLSVSGSFSRALAALDDDERQAVRAAVEEAVAPFREDDGSYTPPAAAWGVVAR